MKTIPFVVAALRVAVPDLAEEPTVREMSQQLDDLDDFATCGLETGT